VNHQESCDDVVRGYYYWEGEGAGGARLNKGCGGCGRRGARCAGEGKEREAVPMRIGGRPRSVVRDEDVVWRGRATLLSPSGCRTRVPGARTWWTVLASSGNWFGTSNFKHCIFFRFRETKKKTTRKICRLVIFLVHNTSDKKNSPGIWLVGWAIALRLLRTSHLHACTFAHSPRP
jgi:hypothetical protein